MMDDCKCEIRCEYCRHVSYYAGGLSKPLSRADNELYCRKHGHYVRDGYRWPRYESCPSVPYCGVDRVFMENMCYFVFMMWDSGNPLISADFVEWCFRSVRTDRKHFDEWFAWWNEYKKTKTPLLPPPVG